MLDITTSEGGAYVDRFVDIVEVGPGPAVIRVFEDARLPGGFLVYVVCFSADRLYVIDPTVNEVVDVLATRRGPHDLLFDAQAGIALLVNFLESTVSVIDVDPDSRAYHSTLTTLGWPRRPRSND